MKDAQPQAIYLKDYTVPAFLIESTDLEFKLEDGETTVSCKIVCVKNPESKSTIADIELHGEQLELQAVLLDGERLADTDYVVTDKSLTVLNVPSQFLLETVVKIKPHENKSLEGLYQSRTMYCTQCEAEGFRKICYYLDRPDVLSKFTTRVEADKNDFPVLLSNGNLVESGELMSGRHFVVWKDPFPKPAYLFALVAGDLEVVKDSFTTCSGKDVAIELFVEAKDVEKCDHAIDSLKRAMCWDEEVYGCEYDLDVYMIVAVDDFNMGAMENKGLNVFNTSCVLAHQKTTTDAGFQRVEAVVAHEYFHNWSGNRVTCRDWFQLSLKEGFTVFRDAEFSSDMNSRSVKRVEDVAFLTSVQFAEDSGPMAHPVQPASFIEISNFYTVTIYEKGAEVVRMVQQLLGPKQFRKGSDLYFSRHDGQAVTCDDFIQAMADVSGKDFTQFKRWYSQAGTPSLSVQGVYNDDAKTYSLSFEQHCDATPGQSEKAPFFIPVKLAFLTEDGLQPLVSSGQALGTETVIEVTDVNQTVVFENVDKNAVPSLLRGFSAPVKLSFAYSDDQLATIICNDTDGFNRWDAMQRLASQQLFDIADGVKDTPDTVLIDAMRRLLDDTELDPAMVGLVLKLPVLSYLAEQRKAVDPMALAKAREVTVAAIASALRSELLNRYHALEVTGTYTPSGDQIGQRALRNTCLSYLTNLDDVEIAGIAQQQFDNADNMTDQFAALCALVHGHGQAFVEKRSAALDAFYQQWKHEALVVNQWLQVQASRNSDDALAVVNALMAHDSFDINNPNKVRSVVSVFAGQNSAFHAKDGSGYAWLADVVLTLNASNPQIASRLLTPLTRWQKYEASYAQLMKAQLQRIQDSGELSKDVYEVVSKSLNA